MGNDNVWYCIQDDCDFCPNKREAAVGEGLKVNDSHEFYLQKGRLCCRVQTKGDGLFLSPSVPYFRGDGLFLKVGGNFYDGKKFVDRKRQFC